MSEDAEIWHYAFERDWRLSIEKCEFEKLFDTYMDNVSPNFYLRHFWKDESGSTGPIIRYITDIERAFAAGMKAQAALSKARKEGEE